MCHNIQMRWILLIALMLLANGCPREPDSARLAGGGTNAHPWEQEGWEHPLRARQRALEAAQQQGSGAETAVEAPALRGPAFSADDTLVEENLPGQWLQVCTVGNERINLVSPDSMDLIELQPSGSLSWAFIGQDGQRFVQGYWEKTGPGQMVLQMGDNPPTDIQAQMYGSEFLFLWSYDLKVGNWLVRLPVQGPPQVLRNTFSTSAGNFVITQLGSLGYRGVVFGEGHYERNVGGAYFPGVLTMVWEEEATNSSGYAAFIVDPEFKSLDGVWWLDDYEAAPFGGSWTGVADDSIELPERFEPEPDAPAQEDTNGGAEPQA